MDAVPVTLGQEFAGYAAQVRQSQKRVESVLGRVGEIPLGGTAVGTGLNTHPEFAERVRRLLSDDLGLEINPRPTRSSRRPRATRSLRPRARSAPWRCR